MLWIGLGFLIGMFARTFGPSARADRGCGRPHAADAQRRVLPRRRFSRDRRAGARHLGLGDNGVDLRYRPPFGALGGRRHVRRADPGEAPPRCPGQVIMETSQGSDVSQGLRASCAST